MRICTAIKVLFAALAVAVSGAAVAGNALIDTSKPLTEQQAARLNSLPFPEPPSL
jgi:hypothetical protein